MVQGYSWLFKVIHGFEKKFGVDGVREVSICEVGKHIRRVIWLNCTGWGMIRTVAILNYG
jgi:hypothetical protein